MAEVWRHAFNLFWIIALQIELGIDGQKALAILHEIDDCGAHPVSFLSRAEFLSSLVTSAKDPRM